MLRFMADPYDDTCSTIFPLLQVILSSVGRSFQYHQPILIAFEQYKRSRKISSNPIDDTKRNFLSSLLHVILTKMKWDPDADPGDVDEDDNAEFEKMRKVQNFLIGTRLPNYDRVFFCRSYEHSWTQSFPSIKISLQEQSVHLH